MNSNESYCHYNNSLTVTLNRVSFLLHLISCLIVNSFRTIPGLQRILKGQKSVFTTI